jgi:hypothetical protein
MRTRPNAIQSIPQPETTGDRSNQSGYQHTIPNVDAQDAETFNKRIQIGLPSLTQRKTPPREGIQRRPQTPFARGLISTKDSDRLASGQREPGARQ